MNEIATQIINQYYPREKETDEWTDKQKIPDTRKTKKTSSRYTEIKKHEWRGSPIFYHHNKEVQERRAMPSLQCLQMIKSCASKILQESTPVLS